MTFEEWLMTGISSGFCSEPVCDTHDGIPMNEGEQNAFEDGWDPCIPAVRLWNVEDRPDVGQRAPG